MIVFHNHLRLTVRYIQAQRIRCFGHIVRMDKERTVERIIEWTLIAVRRICRPRLNGRVMSGYGKNEDLELE
jgi:dethiobiotin synthetase